jgi:hypothetical protein
VKGRVLRGLWRVAPLLLVAISLVVGVWLLVRSPWAAPYLCRGAVPSGVDGPLWDAPLCWLVPN